MKNSLLFQLCALLFVALTGAPAVAQNPIVRDRFTADPAALVHRGRVYLYTGHDEATPQDKRFVMRDWRVYSSNDLIHWKDHGSPMSTKTFAWARSDAWASQVIERNGKFYWYAAIYHATIPGLLPWAWPTGPPAHFGTHAALPLSRTTRGRTQTSPGTTLTPQYSSMTTVKLTSSGATRSADTRSLSRT